MYPGMPPPPSLAELGRSVRVLCYWGAAVGAGLLVLLAFVVTSTYLMFTRREQYLGSSGASMFHGGELFFAWLIGNLAAGFGILMLGVAALVLDIIVLAKLSGVRGRGVPRETTRPVTVAVVVAMGLVSTPAGVLLMLFPSSLFGPGEVTNTVLLVLVVLMFLVPLAGRVAQVLSARQLSGVLGRGGPLTGYPQPTPWPPQG